MRYIGDIGQLDSLIKLVKVNIYLQFSEYCYILPKGTLFTVQFSREIMYDLMIGKSCSKCNIPLELLKFKSGAHLFISKSHDFLVNAQLDGQKIIQN